MKSLILYTSWCIILRYSCSKVGFFQFFDFSCPVQTEITQNHETFNIYLWLGKNFLITWTTRKKVFFLFWVTFGSIFNGLNFSNWPEVKFAIIIFAQIFPECWPRCQFFSKKFWICDTQMSAHNYYFSLPKTAKISQNRGRNLFFFIQST